LKQSGQKQQNCGENTQGQYRCQQIQAHRAAVEEDDDGFPVLPPDCLQVYKILKNGEADLEELQEATGMDPGELLAILMKLELKLLVEKD
jgi:predicted Rossmann fold nucleotide-binding protein DprA/Smf involved in DNA uptake